MPQTIPPKASLLTENAWLALNPFRYPFKSERLVIHVVACATCPPGHPVIKLEDGPEITNKPTTSLEVACRSLLAVAVALLTGPADEVQEDAWGMLAAVASWRQRMLRETRSPRGALLN